MPGFRPRFFVSPAEGGSVRGPAATCLEGTVVTLSSEDSHHARRVLRLSEGDACEVVVGAAVHAASVISAADPVKVLLGTRLQAADAGADYRVRVGLVQALARPAVMDYVIEKGTEVGTSYFVLVRTAGSPKRPDLPGEERTARWGRIAQEAAKQSKQVAVPSIVVAASPGEALNLLGGDGALSLVLEPTATGGLPDRLARQPQPGSVALWVGPEGGWMAAEWEQFSAAGIETVRLGRGVLRTETAGPVAVAVARLALGDW